jgi:uncharacterized protein (DUF697 family)
MAKSSELMNTWNTIKEVDLRPLCQQALNGIRLTVVGAPGSGRSTLTSQMRRDPARPHLETDTPVTILDLETAAQGVDADLIILLIDSRKTDLSGEQTLVQSWSNSGKRTLVFINQFEEPKASQAITPWVDWKSRRVVIGSVLDTHFLVNKFASAVMNLVPNQVLGLGRYFPMFRVPVARYLINDTCLSNAAYSLSTGLAEIVPIFDIPLNVTDMIVLTKTQAFLVYKLGLALGYSTRWQDYVAEFGSVLGTGFLWRQIARGLVGLIPVWGIVPKVAVAYSGTYVVGNVILQWYMTGRHISAKQMRELYRQAFARGSNIAHNLLQKLPRPRLTRPHLPRLSLRRQKAPALPPPTTRRVCSSCGRSSSEDAAFCQYCGKSLQ